MQRCKEIQELNAMIYVTFLLVPSALSQSGWQHSHLATRATRGVLHMCVEGSLDLLYCLFYVAAVEVQVLDPLSEIMIASGRVRTPSSKEWRSSS